MGMVRASNHLNLMIRRIASQVPHVQRLHHLVLLTTNPEACTASCETKLGNPATGGAACC